MSDARDDSSVRCIGFALPVRDIARSARFYTSLLGCPAETAPGGLLFRFWNATILLRRSDHPAIPATSNDLGFRHLAFVVESIASVRERALAAGAVANSATPQRLPEWNPVARDIEAWYFRDPDGHPLELIHFPVGRSRPTGRPGGSSFVLGIDHTAIVVKDTTVSVVFYQHLGFRVVGHALNFGPEQEALTNVPDAVMLITSLSGASGPGIELLQYLRPGLAPGDTPGDRVATLLALSGPVPAHDPDGHCCEVAP